MFYTQQWYQLHDLFTVGSHGNFQTILNSCMSSEMIFTRNLYCSTIWYDDSTV